MICDVSKHQGMIDWDKLAPLLDFVVIKASGLYGNGSDPYYARNVAGAVAHGVPFHAYHFLYCVTESQAKQDARLFYETVRGQGHDPLFWVLDCESQWGVKDKDAAWIVDVFVGELKMLAWKDIRIAIYVAQEKYYSYGIDYSQFAYVWIPGYGEKYKPRMPCDIWQYSDKGKAPGIYGNVDLNKLMGTKPMSFFTTGICEKSKENGGDSPMFTGRQLAEYCEKVYKAGWVYWYGTYGKKCSMSLYESKSKQYYYPKYRHYAPSRKSAYMKDIAEGKTCADCVGMIKAFFWTGGVFGAEPKYGTNHCPDKSANDMIEYCCETGPIKSIPDEPGLVVWKDGHIGVYVGGGYTVEMKGFNYDCKRNKLSAGPWTKWGRLPASMICYDSEPAPAPAPVPSGDVPDISLLGKRMLKKGKSGADVKQLQEALIWLGYDCGGYGADGDFGKATDKAMRAFQTHEGLEADGVFGPMSLTALKVAMAGKDGGGDAKPEPALEPAPDPEPIVRFVEITGDSVNVRSGPGTDGTRVLGIVHKEERLNYQGVNKTVDGREWYLVEYQMQNGWVSSKHAVLV